MRTKMKLTQRREEETKMARKQRKKIGQTGRKWERSTKSRG